MSEIKNITSWGRLSATNYWGNFHSELSFIAKTNRFEWSGYLEVDLKFKSVQEMHQGFDWYEQLLDFVPSNLQRGYLAYFVCNKCKRRAKFLYYQTPFGGYSSEPLCRLCKGLKYQASKKRKARYN